MHLSENSALTLMFFFFYATVFLFILQHAAAKILAMDEDSCLWFALERVCMLFG